VRKAGAFCVASLLLAACAKQESEDLETVRITTRRHLASAPIYIADEEGFFADEGIRLEFIDAPNRSSQAIPLLEQGSFDVLGAAVSVGLFAAVRAGSGIRIVADRGHIGGSCDFNGLIGAGATFSTDAPTAAQLRGKTFSINSATTPELVIDRFLAARGLTSKEMKVVSLAETIEPQALRSGSLHVTYVTEPYLSSLKKEGHRVLGSAREYAAGAHYGVIVFGPTLTVRNRPLGQRFMNAYLRGVRQHAAGPTARNVEIVAKRLKFEPGLLRGACFASVHADGHVDPAWMEEFQRWGVGKGYAKSPIPAATAIDASFARNATSRLSGAARK
jgi:NitT/TauT family transport system substrate-binding protein